MFMSVIMFINNFVGALVVEAIILLLFKEYEKDSTILIASALYIPITYPLSLLSQVVMKGESLSNLLGSSFEMIILPCLIIALSIFGAFIGLKLSKELKRTGKL